MSVFTGLTPKSKELGEKIVSGFNLIGVEGINTSDPRLGPIFEGFLTGSHHTSYLMGNKTESKLNQAVETQGKKEFDFSNIGINASTIRDAEARFDQTYSQLSEDQKKKLQLLRKDFEPFSNYYLEPYWNARPEKISLSDIEKAEIRNFYQNLGLPSDSRFNIDEINQTVQRLRHSIIGNGTEVISLEYFDPIPEQILLMSDFSKKSGCAAISCTCAIGLTMLTYLASGYLPEGFQMCVNTAAVVTVSTGIGYLKGWFNGVLPSRFQLPKLDLKQMVSERDTIMAKRADRALELRLETEEYLLLIAGKLHVAGLLSNFHQKGYQEVTIKDLY